MEKINVSELLKGCPSGMELDCTMFDGVYFDHVDDLRHNSIKCYVNNGNEHFGIALDEHGQYISNKSAKCVIFPKGKTTWEGFQRPFKDGDVLAYTSSHTTVFIYRNKDNEPKHTTSFYVGYTIGGGCYCNFHIYNKSTLIALNGDYDTRLATEEEKAKLFDAIKANGYKWDEKNKTLEKFPKFKVGDRIILKDNPHNIPSIRIKAVTKSQYILENEGFFYISSADEKYVLENKFDITTLKPFESRVLVRTKHFHDKWTSGFFSHIDSDDGFAPFWTTADKNYQQCIPYEGNEHLLGKTDDCDEYFKV